MWQYPATKKYVDGVQEYSFTMLSLEYQGVEVKCIGRKYAQVGILQGGIKE